MRIVKFYAADNTLRVKLDRLEDLWAVQRITFAGDLVKAESQRRFKASESDVGELKDVMIRLRVEKTELDKNASRLRVMGKIVEGRPLEYVRLNSYHTLNVAPGDTIDITKPRWPEYMLDVVKEAVSDMRKPRLGIIVADDEKAQPAYLLGYGLEFRKEIYSGLSKKMTQKDFNEQERKYFQAIADAIAGMNVDTVILAGPGFTKDDVKKYMDANGLTKKLTQRLILESASNPERSGVYELIKGERVASLLEKERIRDEFLLMERFLQGLEGKSSRYGTSNVRDAIEAYEASTILVNDSALGMPEIQEALALAEEKRLAIRVFNSDDEVGQQLHSFKDIASIS
jgi:protein pelota